MRRRTCRPLLMESYSFKATYRLSIMNILLLICWILVICVPLTQRVAFCSHPCSQVLCCSQRANTLWTVSCRLFAHKKVWENFEQCMHMRATKERRGLRQVPWEGAWWRGAIGSIQRWQHWTLSHDSYAYTQAERRTAREDGLDVPTVLVPTTDIYKVNRVKSFQKATVDFLIWHPSHCQTSIFPMTAEVILHAGER